MAIYSYDLQGQKDSFADWISNISPEDTYIVSRSKKESTPQNHFKWQIDALDKVVYDLNSVHDILEGAAAPATDIISVKGTKELNNITQIFRKTFAISDSALATSAHGRQGELKLQLEKAGKELKNVMEVVFSSRQVKQEPNGTTAARTSGLFAQIAALNAVNPDVAVDAATGGKNGIVAADTAVHIEGPVTAANFEKVAKALYLAGSKACCVVTNPLNADALNKVSKDIGVDVRQLQVFQTGINDWEPGKTFNNEQHTITDERGLNWCVCFSRFCPVDLVYFIDPETLTQRVLREPKATQLGRQGAAEIWQLVIEAGLCLANPFAAGVIEVKP